MRFASGPELGPPWGVGDPVDADVDGGPPAVGAAAPAAPVDAAADAAAPVDAEAEDGFGESLPAFAAVDGDGLAPAAADVESGPAIAEVVVGCCCGCEGNTIPRVCEGPSGVAAARGSERKQAGKRSPRLGRAEVATRRAVRAP